MRELAAVFGLAAALVCAAILTGMVVTGVRTGRIGTEHHTPPIPFHSRPVAFVVLWAFYLLVVGLLSFAAVRIIAGLLSTP